MGSYSDPRTLIFLGAGHWKAGDASFRGLHPTFSSKKQIVPLFSMLLMHCCQTQECGTSGFICRNTANAHERLGFGEGGSTEACKPELS